MSGMWRVALTVHEDVVQNFAQVLESHVDAVSTFELEEGGNWLIEGTSHGEPDQSRLVARVTVLAMALGVPQPQIEVEPLAPIDWVTQTYLSFPPIRAGRFFVHGSHHKKPVPAGAIGLLIEAAMAFGSGEHATTQGCLRALSDLNKSMPVTRALDMGCGSGILAFAIAKLWHAPVAAVDIDALSIMIAAENARLNKVNKLVTCRGGDGYRTPIVRQKGPYDLIVANILARPLARMAPQLRRNLRRGGVAVLSGLLARQEKLVIAAHRRQGLKLVRRYQIGEWNTLVMKG
ncbi:50S ribosomal protein L11 methyltransferase [Nitrospirillum bahiense]|uniref:Ribosomal protein L11 methyltransferase n=1 Tax=Nitrospirillum amazonense TaxID=28077 RepID=A0A560FZW2_9PROT|nr:50S ribosomal protein L11 methyltransferase [Nitrospirillum amazonense]TWB27119.1 [LSU ribosomal protein L11P]-lysine N-methyltransferase [Nitrospirillum amazonense]